MMSEINKESLGEETYKIYRRKVYVRWRNMINRCHNTEHLSYSTYGGKGVHVCERWLSDFENYLEDIPKVEGFNYEGFMDGAIFLDKDKKQIGLKEKVYSLETCVFLTLEENNSLAEDIQEFYVVTPEGEIIHGSSIHKFCTEHNLISAHASLMWHGSKLRRSIKGYQFFDHYPDPHEIRERKVYVGVSPTGEKHERHSYKEFVEDFGVTMGKIRYSVDKQKKNGDGWLFYLKNPDGYTLHPSRTSKGSSYNERFSNKRFNN